MQEYKEYIPCSYQDILNDGTSLGLQLITCRPKKQKETTYPQYNCVGRFEKLRLLSHYCISHYLDIIPAKHNETYLLCETYEKTLPEILTTLDEKKGIRLLQDIIEAYDYLHQHNIIVGYLNTSNIYYTNTNIGKLGNYALYHLSQSNKYFTCAFKFPTIAPEVLLNRNHSCSVESDIYSLGMLYIIIHMQFIPSKKQYISWVMALFELSSHCKECINCQQLNCEEFTHKVDELNKLYFDKETHLNPLLTSCVCPIPTIRPTISMLLENKIFSERRPIIQPQDKELLELLNFSYNAPKYFMTRREVLHEMCYLKLLNTDIPKKYIEIMGKVYGEMAKYPIFNLERFVSIERDVSAEEVQNDFTIYSISVEDIINPSIVIDKELDGYVKSEGNQIENTSSSEKLPFFVNILTQQFSTCPVTDVVRYHRLYHAYFRFLSRYAAENPNLVGTIVHKVERVAQSFVPEFLRLPVWMLFLGIDVNLAYKRYNERSKSVPLIISSNDIDEDTRVIVEDVNRAFSTVPIIANEVTRSQLKRVLFSFLRSGEEYCQGIHSVCAVFLSLSFNEAICSECLHRFEADFVRQYSPENFRIYFIRLCQLLSFHGPKVAPTMSSRVIENSTAIRWFLPLLSLSMKLSSIYQLWDWVLQSPKFAKFMFFLLAYILSCEPMILEYNDPFDLILHFNKVEFDQADVIEQCTSQFNNLISTSPISYTENHISPSHPSRSTPYASLANQAIDESSMVVVPLLDQSDLQFTMYNTSSLYVDMRPESTYHTLAPKSLRVIFNKPEDVVSEVSSALRGFDDVYPAFVVLISDWDETNDVDISTIYLQMMTVADSLVKNGFSHICMSAVPFHSLHRQFFTENEVVKTEQDDHDEDVV
ncbi:Rab GTPase activating protein, putative [Entamoeba histolytica HM-3:IMSS]|uniref:Rab GTPase activating protein, putative n=1 Tax=Entamoeba histolytica HM-3:IMSS TaxID=885315 RepID=M7X8U1_ENTHI|nr:Rab GTPase activating protein, putative [Entamoeba histolytica HM-3:IMSS]